MIARPDGVILVTGPTGSGKTTTLYSILNHINTESVNIMTLEDPVEYPMNMIRQTSVNESAKLGFANGIRSMMRQDPDVILVGEIRDEETAEMAFAAAMTGHQVYSTLHTNSAIGAIRACSTSACCPTSWPATSSASSPSAWCASCARTAAKPMWPTTSNAACSACPRTGPQTLYRPVGCDKCAHQGYKGRIAIMELLKMTPRSTN
jgi:general secretion pathway protein E/type IV pilus assembly protein PilB